MTLMSASVLVFADNAGLRLWGSQGKSCPLYKPEEKMTFKVKLLKGNSPVTGTLLKWTRTGDDGITETGQGTSSEKGLEITTSMDKPGFVRIYVTAYDKSGNVIKGKNGKPIFFDGGAGVDPEKLQSVPEPEDFDEFWKKQKAKLAAVPMKVLEMKELKGNKDVKAYDVKVSCAGGMPVSGYLTMPRNAKKKSLSAVVFFRGYGVKGADIRLDKGKNQIFFYVNAHGIKNGMPDSYYKNLEQTTLKKYGFSKKENSNPETCYFNGMMLRAMRAMEFVKSLPEWNGKWLRTDGGSQGGFQALVAAGLDKDVNYCRAMKPWNCDFGRTEMGRIVGSWFVEYTPALRYYDPVNHVKRANPKCRLFIMANLGDYVCPPSGVWIAYNNFPGPKTMEMRQGCEHQYNMPDYPKSLVTSDNK